MASIVQVSSRPRDALQIATARLYRFALVLSVNEELARALLRGTYKGLLLPKNAAGEERDTLIEAFRRMYALWNAKLNEDAGIQKRCPPEARLFAGSFTQGPLPDNARFARFVANMPSQQRAALYLVYGEGASYDEAAEVTGLDMLSLMKLLARGHVVLGQALDRGASSEYEMDTSPGQERAA